MKYLLTKKKEYEEQLQAYEEQMQELQARIRCCVDGVGGGRGESENDAGFDL